MKKISYLCCLLVSILFIPRVYAFTYELGVSVPYLEVPLGTETEIRVSLKNIHGTNDGIASCSLNIEFDSNILLNSKVRTLGSWTLTTGKIYLFDTGNFALNDTELFIIPVKVNGDGNVKLVNIECSDGNTSVKVQNEIIDFVVKKNNSDSGNAINNIGNADSNNTNNEMYIDNSSYQLSENSDCDLSDIILSDGTIEFDPDVAEYEIEVSDYNSLVVEPILANNKSTYTLEKKDDYSVIINVRAEDGSYKIYTIFVVENFTENKEKSNNFVPIFIVIICILVLINIIRIIRNRKDG